jgi:excinuclease ABC subunit A
VDFIATVDRTLTSVASPGEASQRIVCGGLAPACEGRFRTGNQIDTSAPVAIILSPYNGQSVPQNDLISISTKVTDDVCGGKRFDKETLTVKYKKKNIYEVLRMTVEEGLKFFKDIPTIYDRLQTLMDVGLGYLELGQSATTLSGGEAQRVKISSELYRPHLEKTIYLLDEPTVGLHYDDVAKLLEVLNKLVSKGNTVVLIEHNLDIIKNSDYLLDFGPEGGTGGGHIIAKGTPEEVANNPKSYTGKYLKKILRK